MFDFILIKYFNFIFYSYYAFLNIRVALKSFDHNWLRWLIQKSLSSWIKKIFLFFRLVRFWMNGPTGLRVLKYVALEPVVGLAIALFRNRMVQLRHHSGVTETCLTTKYACCR